MNIFVGWFSRMHLLSGMRFQIQSNLLPYSLFSLFLITDSAVPRKQGELIYLHLPLNLHSKLEQTTF